MIGSVLEKVNKATGRLGEYNLIIRRMQAQVHYVAVDQVEKSKAWSRTRASLEADQRQSVNAAAEQFLQQKEALDAQHETILELERTIQRMTEAAGKEREELLQVDIAALL